MDKNRVKKQVIVDKKAYRELKSKLALQDKTISSWLDEKMREELK